MFYFILSLVLLMLSMFTKSDSKQETEDQESPDFDLTSDIPYVKDGLPEQHLDLYLPKGHEASKPIPIIMMIHQGGSNKSHMGGLAKRFTKLNFAVVSIDHRQGPVNSFKAIYEDSVCSFGWIHSNAEKYGFDRDKVYLFGYSSGGTMSSFLGVVKDYSDYSGACGVELPEDMAVAGVVAYTGIFDYEKYSEIEPWAPYLNGLMGGDYASSPELWKEASPINHVSETDTEFLLLHGEKDDMILPSQSIDFAAALENSGVKVTVHVIPDVAHMDLIASESAFDIAKDFMVKLAK